MTDPAVFSFPYGPTIIAIGRDADCAVRLSAVGVSRHHAQIICMADGPYVYDGGSASGTLLDGVAINSAKLPSLCIITVGVIELKVETDGSTITLTRLSRSRNEGPVPSQALDQEIVVGRAAGSSIVLDHPSVSRRHCSIICSGGSWHILDEGSANGTFVNGTLVHRGNLSEGDVVDIGPFRLLLRNNRIESLAGSGKVGVETIHLSCSQGGKRILADVSLSIAPGEFVALLGPSGAGKTTLARALIGDVQPSAGAILYNGSPFGTFYAAFRSSLGYVSQQVLLRDELTVLETLVEQAILRLPRDTDAAERRGRIKTVAGLLSIDGIFDRRIARLSGGEARRVHLAVELLSSPAVIVLDEPLAGLDASLVARFMKLFKSLAAQGHTIILTTHRLELLHLCDRLFFLSDGRLVFTGTHDEALERIGVATVADAYERVKDGWVDAHIPEPARNTVPPAEVAVKKRPQGAPLIHQLPLLANRYFKVLRRDRTNLVLLLAQPPLIAALLSLVYARGMEELPVSFYFCLTLAAVWTGGVNAIREFAREWSLYGREYRAGLLSGAYCFSKIAVLSLLSTVQAAVFTVSLAFLFNGCRLSGDLFLITAAATISGTLLGLAISAFAGNVNRALSILPLIFIPQIFFSGVLVPFDLMPDFGELFSRITITRPVFSLYKHIEILAQPTADAEWLWLAMANGFSIILILVGLALGRRRFSGR